METQPIAYARIIEQNGFARSNCGLLNGNMGLALFYYTLAKKTGDNNFEKIADCLIDNVITGTKNLSISNFENGLAGIGWGIEYFIQKRYVKGNANEILEDIDTRIFKILTEYNQTSFEFTTGLTGYLYYLIYRLKNDRSNSSTSLINKELLVFSINKIDEIASLEFLHIVKDISFDLFWKFPLILLVFGEAYNLKIYNVKINNIIKQWTEYFEVFLPSLHINRFYLSFALNRFNNVIPQPRLSKQIQILLTSIDKEILLKEIDYQLLSLRAGWPGVLYLLFLAQRDFNEQPQYKKIIHELYSSTIDGYKNQISNIHNNIKKKLPYQSGLSYGLSGIGLIQLIEPECIPLKLISNQV